MIHREQLYEMELFFLKLSDMSVEDFRIMQDSIREAAAAFRAVVQAEVEQ